MSHDSGFPRRRKSAVGLIILLAGAAVLGLAFVFRADILKWVGIGGGA